MLRRRQGRAIEQAPICCGHLSGLKTKVKSMDSYAGFKASSEVNLSRDFSLCIQVTICCRPAGRLLQAPFIANPRRRSGAANMRSGSRFAGPENAPLYESWCQRSVGRASLSTSHCLDQTSKVSRSLAFPHWFAPATCRPAIVQGCRSFDVLLGR